MSPLKPRSAWMISESVLSGQSDERLVALFRAGHEAAFDAIVRRYRRPLLAYCRRFVDEGRSEDVIQQALLNAYKAFPSAERDLEVRPWLYRIVRNASLDALRSSRRDELPLHEDLESGEAPEQTAERRQQLRETVANLQRLPERQRDAIVLRELEGRSHEEIAAHIGVTEGAVRQLIHRARGSLRTAASAAIPLAWLGPLIRAPRAEAFAARLPELVTGAAAAGGTAKATVVVVAIVGISSGGAIGTLDRVAARSDSPRPALASGAVRPAQPIPTSLGSGLGRDPKSGAGPGDAGRDRARGEARTGSAPAGRTRSDGARRRADGTLADDRDRGSRKGDEGRPGIAAPAFSEPREHDDDTDEPASEESSEREEDDPGEASAEMEPRDDDEEEPDPAAGYPPVEAGEPSDSEAASPAAADERAAESGARAESSASQAVSPADRDRSKD